MRRRCSLQAMAAACIENKALMTLRTKRKEAMDKIKAVGKGELPQFGDAEVEKEACQHGGQHKVLGTDLMSAIRAVAQGNGNKAATAFGKVVPAGLKYPLAPDLEGVLRGAGA